MDDYEQVVKTGYIWESDVDEGNEGGICECGLLLQIKRPKTKTWHKIKCPKCGHVANLFCGGSEDKKLGTQQIYIL